MDLFWKLLILEVIGGLALILIFIFLIHIISKSILKRRYKPENDRTRPVEEFAGPESPTNTGVGNALVEGRSILPDSVTESIKSDSRESKDAKSTHTSTNTHSTSTELTHPMSFNDRRKLWLN